MQLSAFLTGRHLFVAIEGQELVWALLSTRWLEFGDVQNQRDQESNQESSRRWFWECFGIEGPLGAVFTYASLTIPRNGHNYQVASTSHFLSEVTLLCPNAKMLRSCVYSWKGISVRRNKCLTIDRCVDNKLTCVLTFHRQWVDLNQHAMSPSAPLNGLPVLVLVMPWGVDLLGDDKVVCCTATQDFQVKIFEQLWVDQSVTRFQGDSKGSASPAQHAAIFERSTEKLAMFAGCSWTQNSRLQNTCLMTSLQRCLQESHATASQ